MLEARHLLKRFSGVTAVRDVTFTLHPGDVIWFGCDGPTVPALRHGDLVEVANSAIGVLANRVVAAQHRT